MTAAGLFSLMVLVRLLNSSPGPVVIVRRSPMRMADAASSTDTAEAEVQGAVSLLPTETDAGCGSNCRSKNPGRPSALSGTLVTGCCHRAWVADTVATVTTSPCPTGGRSPAMPGPVAPAADMLPRPLMKWSPMPPKRSSTARSNSPGQSGWATPPSVPRVVGCAA